MNNLFTIPVNASNDYPNGVEQDLLNTCSVQSALLRNEIKKRMEKAIEKVREILKPLLDFLNKKSNQELNNDWTKLFPPTEERAKMLYKAMRIRQGIRYKTREE